MRKYGSLGDQKMARFSGLLRGSVELFPRRSRHNSGKAGPCTLLKVSSKFRPAKNRKEVGVDDASTSNNGRRWSERLKGEREHL